MKWKVIIAIPIVLLMSATDTLGIYDITIESKVVGVNATGISLTMYGSWDTEITSIAVPVVVRTVTGGAFWTGILPYDTSLEGSLYQHNVSWNFTTSTPGSPWTTMLKWFQPFNPSAPCYDDGDVGYDGISPDHFYIAGLGHENSKYNPIEQNLPFCTWVFDVNGNEGIFEFDTGCYCLPISTMYLIDREYPWINRGPFGTNEISFTKGVITIVESTCECAAFCDMDEALPMGFTPVDVAYIVNYVYKGFDARPVLPNCPGDNGDWNCDGMVTPLDVTWYVQFVYRSSGVGPCNPCDCLPAYPDDCPPYP